MTPTSHADQSLGHSTLSYLEAILEMILHLPLALDGPKDSWNITQNFVHKQKATDPQRKVANNAESIEI